MEATFSAAQLTPWLAAVHAGQPVAAPAEGVYGYVANPFNSVALQAVYEAKNRSLNKGFIVLIQSLSQLPLLCPSLPEACLQAVHTYWQPHQPPTTLILPALPTLPSLLTGGLPTIAVRLPHSPYMQEYLLAASMPLVSTSLNLSGQPPALSVAEIPAGIRALTVPAPLSGTPSRIFNPITGQWLR